MEYMMGGGRRLILFFKLPGDRSSRFSLGARYGEIEKWSLFYGSAVASPVSNKSPTTLGATTNRIWLSMI